jgi:hypothetical protein
LIAFRGALASLVYGVVPANETADCSVRERAAVRLLWDRRDEEVGELYAALLEPSGPIFGPLSSLHRQVWAAEPCRLDDPRDIAELETASCLIAPE